METFDGSARLEWWANSSTLLGAVEVSVVITNNGADWSAHGFLADEGDREEFAACCELDPVFLLRFEDDSTVTVTVRPSDGHRRFTLTERSPDPRSVEIA